MILSINKEVWWLKRRFCVILLIKIRRSLLKLMVRLFTENAYFFKINFLKVKGSLFSRSSVIFEDRGVLFMVAINNFFDFGPLLISWWGFFKVELHFLRSRFRPWPLFCSWLRFLTVIFDSDFYHFFWHPLKSSR